MENTMNEQHGSHANADTSQFFKSDPDNKIQISSAGFEFNTNDRKWVLDSETTVNVEVVWTYPKEYQKNILTTLEHFAKTRSAKYVAMHTNELKRFFEAWKGFYVSGFD